MGSVVVVVVGHLRRLPVPGRDAHKEFVLKVTVNVRQSVKVVEVTFTLLNLRSQHLTDHSPNA